MNDQIYNMLIQKDEITWQSILLDLIKSEQMNPWNIDITLLTKRYLEAVRKMQEANFFISGKVLLACALLLKIKSNKLVNEEIYNFDSQLFKQEETYEELEELFNQAPLPNYERPKLTIKTPLPRKRKVTLQDLMTALQKALEVEKRRNVKRELFNSVKVEIPQKKIDISELITSVYTKIVDYFKTRKEKLTFTKLVNSDKKEDKVLTFIPLLHLDNQEKIIISQDEPFGEINIEIYQKNN
jgi:segregation and condensation protein A